MSAESDRLPLSAIEVRLLGCLIEKQATTPETYPLTLNALMLASNQKTSREPVLALTEGQIGQALRRLEEQGFVRLVMGGRADRWEHRLDKALELVKPQLALLALLFLRGPQTAAELLARSNRLHGFEDVAEVVHQLERLIARELVCLIGRQAGQREDRYSHQLGDPADLQTLLSVREVQASVPMVDNNRIAELEARICALEERLAQLEVKV